VAVAVAVVLTGELAPPRTTVIDRQPRRVNWAAALLRSSLLRVSVGHLPLDIFPPVHFPLTQTVNLTLTLTLILTLRTLTLLTLP